MRTRPTLASALHAHGGAVSAKTVALESTIAQLEQSLHAEVTRVSSLLAEGEQLEFRVTTDPKTGKMKAVDVTGPDGAYVQGAPREPRYDDDEYY